FEFSHRSIPDDHGRWRKRLFIMRSSPRPNIHTDPALRNIAVHRFAAFRGIDALHNHMIDRQDDLVSAQVENLACDVQFVGFELGIPHNSALSLHEGIRHSAADQYSVDAFQKALDEADYVRILGAPAN